MLLVLIWIALTSQGNSNEYQQLCFYKENQKKYRISIIKWEVISYPFFFFFFWSPYQVDSLLQVITVILKILGAQCGN